MGDAVHRFLVWSLQWSPQQATEPFLIMGAVFCVATFPLLILSLRTVPRRFEAWQCQNCGYPLVGLQHAHCPECGQPFFPDEIPAPPETFNP